MTTQMQGKIADKDWARQAFFVPGKALKDRSNSKRYSSATLKYTDTTFGGNFSINARPQFTRWADPKSPGLSVSSKGMGEYYAEAIDDNTQRIYLQFGLPKFNSATSFFGNYYDAQMGHMANTGDSRGFVFSIGKVVGYVLTLPLQVLVGAQNLVTRLISTAGGNPYSKFYYLDETMPLYWSSVSSMVNRLGVNMGVLEAPRISGGNGNFSNDGIPTQKELTKMHKLLPDVWGENGSFDVFAAANRAQRLATQHHKTLAKIADGGDDYGERVREYLETKMPPPPVSKWDKAAAAQVDGEGRKTYPGLPAYLENYYRDGPIGSGYGVAGTPIDPTQQQEDKQAALNYANSTGGNPRKYTESPSAGFLDYANANLNDGSSWVGFSVDYEGTSSESFSNSAKQSEVAGKMNSISSGSRDKMFSISGGNMGDNAILETIEGVVGGVTDLVQGTLASVGLSGIAQLAGNAFVDIPDFWESASANLTKSDYTIKLATPYGNKISILQDIYAPLCMLLAGALPRATGKHSHTSPFLCRLHSDGRNIIKLGLIDSISITRGTGGVGWSVDGLPTAIDVSFSILNLDKILSVPMDSLSGPWDTMKLDKFDEDSPYTDYMAALGGLGVYDQYYLSSRLKLAWRQQMASFDSWNSPSHFAAMAAGSGPGRLLSAIYKGGARR